jgi:hypothetical protein
MKYTFRKYEFSTEAEARAAIDALGTATDMEGNEVPTHRHTIATLGHIVTTAATYDDDGEELTAAQLADNYSVDVLWRDEIAEDWASHIVWPDPVGVHSFGNSEANAEYTATLYALFPDRVPVIDNDLND